MSTSAESKTFLPKDNIDAELAEIGREFGLSRERIRQLQALALRKLRSVHGDAALKQFVSA